MIYKTKAFFEPLNLLAVLFNGIIARDFKTECGFDQRPSFGLDDTT